YSIWSRTLRLGYHSNQDELHLSEVNRRLSYSAAVLLVVAIAIGIWMPEPLKQAIDVIVDIG
ncbi:MAG: hydrogenase 4 subunit F, partial [Alistipes sp.]|nr:hydrogenase 4 subunit F [Alistipes sp.]